MDGFSSQDRDLLVRTVIGEAGNQSDEGKAAVAHVVLNRLNQGGYGESIPEVLFKPKQFEPWNTRAKELMSYKEDDPAYSKTAKIVDDVITGNIKDPTNGATHFANIKTVKDRGNTSALKWINGMDNVSQIGSHTFGNADAGKTKVAKEDFKDLIEEFGGSTKKENGSATDDYKDLIQEFTAPKKEIVAPTPVVAAPNEIPANVPTPERFVQGVEQFGVNTEKHATNPLVKGITEDIPAGVAAIPKIPVNVAKAIGNEAIAAKNTVSEGVSDIGQNRPAAGVGKIALGAMQGVFSPLTGTVKELVEKPVTELTGNPDIGSKAGFVASGAVPVNKLGRALNAARPSERAITSIVDAIGPENIPSVIERMRANPSLSLFDVSPGVQQMSQKLILTEGPHQNKFVKHVMDRNDAAKGNVTGAVDATMGPPVNVVDKIEKMKLDAKTTGQNLINPIVEKAGPVDVTSVVKHIENEIGDSVVGRQTLKQLKAGEPVTMAPSPVQEKLMQVREKLRGDWKDREEMFLDAHGEQGAHNVQRTLRAEAQNLLESSTGSDRALGRKLMDVRNKIVDAIDKNTNGEYKKGLSQYADDMHVQEAFDKGTNILKNPTAFANRPEFLEKWWSGAKDAEKEALKEGTRVAYDTALRGYKNGARKAEDIVSVDFNVKNLETIFGKKEAQKMKRTLDDEHAKAVSNQKLIEGSQTAMRLKNDARVDLPKPGQKTGLNAVVPAALETLSYLGTGTVGPGTAAFIAAKGVGKVHDATKLKLAKKTNESMTDLLTSTGQSREDLLNTLSSHIPGPKVPMLQKINSSLRFIGP